MRWIYEFIRAWLALIPVPVKLDERSLQEVISRDRNRRALARTLQS